MPSVKLSRREIGGINVGQGALPAGAEMCASHVGGNTYKSDFYLAGSGRSFQTNNITPELTARGLPTPDGLEYLVDATPSLGGPIVRDRLWFFVSRDGTSRTASTRPARGIGTAARQTASTISTYRAEGLGTRAPGRAARGRAIIDRLLQRWRLIPLDGPSVRALHLWCEAMKEASVLDRIFRHYSQPVCAARMISSDEGASHDCFGSAALAPSFRA